MNRLHTNTRSYTAICCALFATSTLIGCNKDRSSSKKQTSTDFPVLELSQEFQTASSRLDSILDRGKLRVLTRTNPSSYFLYRGQEMGFDYELARRFAKKLKVELEIIVPPTRRDLTNWLAQGGGDLVIASMTKPWTPTLGISTSVPYGHTHSVLVCSSAARAKCQQIDDIEGQTVYVRRQSPEAEQLKRLSKIAPIPFEIEEVPDHIEVQELIDKLASGEMGYAVASSEHAQVALTYYEQLQLGFPISETEAIVWLVPSSSPSLLQKVNDFIQKHYPIRDGIPAPSRLYRLLYSRYFENARSYKQRLESPYFTGKTKVISPYDDLLKEMAKQYGFDWRLLAAQMYQESNFRTDAKSWAGATGLMQLIPRTFYTMGFRKINNPKENTEAGVAYLKYLFDSFSPDQIERSERLKFALASYNAGRGHVIDAQLLAGQLKLDPYRWRNGIEKTLLLLMQRKYYENTKHGYCRGVETVRYVNQIMKRYEVYKKFIPL